MMRSLSIFLFCCMFGPAVQAQPTYSSTFIHDPETLVDFVVDCAEFWSGVEDESYGGYFVGVDREGNPMAPWDKGIVAESRDAYGFVRAFMITGNEIYLDKARSALTFMYEHLWDAANSGWYPSTNRSGCCPNPGTKSAFDQHYALLGITAMFEATGDSTDWDRLMAGYAFNEDHLWDTDSLLFGYYDYTNEDGSASNGKSFNATVDAVTTHLYSLYLLTGDAVYYDRLMQLKRNMIDRLIGSMADQAIGFAELYNTDWTVNESQDRTIMGHVLKTGWCLARIYRIQAEVESLDGAETLVQEVLTKAYDHVYGGPYKDYNKNTGVMQMYGAFDTAKAWWQIEQAITAGFLLFDITWNPEYLEMADESLDFYMKHFVDPVYGEVYADRARNGGRVYYNGGYWDENKGSFGKAAYHSIETGYYSYLYSKLLVKQEPVTLYYRYAISSADRLLNYNPVAVDFDKLMIVNVQLDGSPYAAFDTMARTIDIPAGTSGVFAVTYAMDGLGEVEYEEVISGIAWQELEAEIYPNPASDFVEVHLPLNSGSHDYVVTLIDGAGRNVLTSITSGDRITLDIREVPAGAYVLQVENGEAVKSELLIIQ